VTGSQPFSLAQGFLSLEPRDGRPRDGHFGWKIAHDQMRRAAVKYSRADSVDLFSDAKVTLPAKFRALHRGELLVTVCRCAHWNGCRSWRKTTCIYS
jgi:hypothetical protein